jgi:hypothetical protein
MVKFLIRKKEVKNLLECTEMASTSVARFTKPNDPPAKKEKSSKVNQRK